MKILCPRIRIVQLILFELNWQADMLSISLENWRIIPHVMLIRVFPPVLSRARVKLVLKADALLYH